MFILRKSMKVKHYILVLLLIAPLFSFAQNVIKGTVTDTKSTVIPFANIVLQSKTDSLLISGVTTDMDGKFVLNFNGNTQNYLLRVSYIGYATKYVPIDKLDLGVIQLNENTQQLGDVVISAARPVYKMGTEGLQVHVQNTLLSKLGNANDVLSQLPFVKSQNDKYTIFGRGTPLIYINNRLLRNNDELRQLNSADIKEVKVVLNSGAQYSASVGAVIHITTIKPVGEGLGGSLYGKVLQGRKFSHYESVNLNYRKNKWDLFGDIGYNEKSTQQHQVDNTILTLENQYKIDDQNLMSAKTHIWNSSLGMNYSFSPTHLMGIRYKLYRMPDSRWNTQGESSQFVDGVSEDHDLLNDRRNSSLTQHLVNFYYYKEFSPQTSLRVETDYLKGNSTNTQEMVEESLDKNISTQADSTVRVNSHSNSNSSYWGGKAVFETALLMGKITLGGELSYSRNKQNYQRLGNDPNPDQKMSDNLSKQKMAAGFLSFSRSWNHFSLRTGVRYEYIDFQYFNEQKRSDEQSRIYKKFFPDLSFSYERGVINMSLTSRSTVQRPHYYYMRSDVAYNGPYVYEGGNPSLVPTYTHKLSYLFGWKSLQLELTYNWIKDNILLVGEQYGNKPLILYTMINLPNSNQLDAALFYSPTVGCWHPAFGIEMSKQYLVYKGRSYNKPTFSYTFNNLVELPKAIRLSLNMRGSTKGESELSLYKPVFRADIRLSRLFLKDKLNVTLGANDLFATDQERWSMFSGNVYNYKRNDGDNRCVYLQITYTFNPTRSKYKGEGVNNSEINRF